MDDDPASDVSNERPEPWHQFGTFNSKMKNRFTLDPESGFVYDRETQTWLTTVEEVFDALWIFLPNSEDSENDGVEPH